jgi:glutathione S-transferase
MPLLRIYTITAVVLAFKMFANSFVQGRARAQAKVFGNPEDAAMFGGRVEPQELPAVQRAAACWRNDLENIPIFLILAWIYVMGGLSVSVFEIYCIIFMIARIFHTFFYLNGVQPWRTVSYTIGALVTIALMINLLIKVAAA